MNDATAGRALRVLRRRQHLRQLDVARRAGVSQQLVSKVECGHLGSVNVATLRGILAAVEADLVTIVRWRGGELDRLLDERHAAVVSQIAGLLRRRGWDVLLEATFSEYGERGSIDLLAWHAATRTLLVVEVKTEVASAEEMLRRHDAKVRLAPKIGRDRFGEAPRQVGRLLVLDESGRNRRRVDRLEAILRSAYPARGGDVRAWLASPMGNLSGLVFLTVASRSQPTRTTRGPRRSPESAVAAGRS